MNEPGSHHVYFDSAHFRASHRHLTAAPPFPVTELGYQVPAEFVKRGSRAAPTCSGTPCCRACGMALDQTNRHAEALKRIGYALGGYLSLEGLLTGGGTGNLG